MMTKPATPPASLPLALPQPRLEDHLASDASFPSAYLRAIGAVACADGAVSLAEYAALNEILRLSGESALAGMTLLDALESPRPLAAALDGLHRASTGVDAAVRRTAFDAARPLLALQGANSRALAGDFAGALQHPLAPAERDEFVGPAETGFWNGLARRSLRLVKGGELQALAEQCIRLTGAADLARQLRAYEEGELDAEALQVRIAEACSTLGAQLDDYERGLQLAEVAGASAAGFLATAQELHRQVGQRLAVVQARIDFERASFADDIADAVHDAGNAVELEVHERLKTDRWKLAEVWERIGRTTLAKELERRVDRLVSRREASLRLLKEDLRLFQEEMRLTRASILERRHHTELAALMPPLRLGTRVANAMDGAAGITLGLGAVSLAGAGTAAYLLGTAAVLPVIAPVAPIVGGAMLVAGAFKWLTDSDRRKDDEIRHKREAFEQAFRTQIEAARAAFEQQLDAVGDEFLQTARQVVEPVVLEAAAGERIAREQMQMAERLIRQSRSALAQLTQQLGRG